MAGFRTHITASTALGIGYAAGAHYFFGVPPETCVLAGGLCSVSGMLPDLDSDSGVPLRESVAFAAAAVPVMMIRRFERLGMPLETMILAGMGIYLVLRFGLATLLKKYTVHRGMFHSLPAALIAAELTFLIFDRDDLWLRYYTAGAVLVGFLSHLVLDEIWSIGFRHGLPRLKKSFGTAMKIWGDSLWANVSTYAKVILLTYLVVQDPQWMAQFDTLGNRSQQLAGRTTAAQETAPKESAVSAGAGGGEISATPPVYYDPAQIGSRNRDGRWR
jgi:membrane-bound metal-dependent hydrolase YbcI (DUF457 family)